jgi:drug/metabolite transporter (DMT)-like permease
VAALPFALLEGSLALPARADAWLSVLAIAVISTVVAVRAFISGMNRIGPARASVLSSLEVVMATGLAITFLGERLSLAQLLGAALIVGGVALQNMAVLRQFAGIFAHWKTPPASTMIGGKEH